VQNIAVIERDTDTDDDDDDDDDDDENLSSNSDDVSDADSAEVADNYSNNRDVDAASVHREEATEASKRLTHSLARIKMPKTTSGGKHRSRPRIEVLPVSSAQDASTASDQLHRWLTAEPSN